MGLKKRSNALVTTTARGVAKWTEDCLDIASGILDGAVTLMVSLGCIVET